MTDPTKEVPLSIEQQTLNNTINRMTQQYMNHEVEMSNMTAEVFRLRKIIEEQNTLLEAISTEAQDTKPEPKNK